MFDLPKLYLARHGDTAWTDSHQHTGRTDLPLNERGEDRARKLGRVLLPMPFLHVFTSNVSAIALYRRQGMEIRCRLHITVLQKQG